MKHILTTIALLASTPAMAQSFTGPRVGAEVSVTAERLLDGDNEKAWAVNAGYDHDFGKIVVGGEVGYSDLISDNPIHPAEFTLTSRVGYKVTDSTLIYALAGGRKLDTDLGNTTGFTLGGGIEQRLGARFYIRGEGRYVKYPHVGQGDGAQQIALGAGFRF